MVLSATANNHTLRAMDAAVQRLGQSLVNPSVYFKPVAQPISKRPATTRYTHAIPVSFLCLIPRMKSM
jgi:hypothetical protein